MTKPVMQRATYQEQADRMTWLARKVMYNELKRLQKQLRGHLCKSDVCGKAVPSANSQKSPKANASITTKVPL